MSHADDEALVASALTGARAPQRLLARRLLQCIRREVAIMLARAARPHARDPRQDVYDLAQEVLLGLFERDARELRRWDPERGRSLDNFVRLVTRRRVARILRQRVGNPWADEPTDPVDLDEGDEELLMRRLENRHQLDSVLVALYGKMSRRDQELFELVFVEELDPGMVAEQMDMTRPAVNAWSYRMRKLARSVARKLDFGKSSPAVSTPKEKTSHGG